MIIRFSVLSSFLLLCGVALGQGRLIAVDSSRALYEIDMSTGAKTQIGTVSANAGTTGGLAYDRLNNVMYLTSTSLDSLFTLDIASGAATLVGAYDPAVAAIVMHGIEYDDSTSQLYGISIHNTGTFYSINKTTGAATAIGTTTGTASFQNLGYNSDTDTMYMTSGGRTGGIAEALHSINRATGAVTDIGPLGAVSTNPNGLAYNFDNDTMYMIDNTADNLFSVDLSTGAATVIGSTGAGNLLGLAYVNPVPEPATLAVLGLGIFAALRRQKARRA